MPSRISSALRDGTLSGTLNGNESPSYPPSFFFGSGSLGLRRGRLIPLLSASAPDESGSLQPLDRHKAPGLHDGGPRQLSPIEMTTIAPVSGIHRATGCFGRPTELSFTGLVALASSLARGFQGSWMGTLQKSKGCPGKRLVF